VADAEIRVKPGGGAKTLCRLMMVRHDAAWALVDSHITNDFLEKAVLDGWIMDAPRDIHREVVHGESRLDLGCTNSEGIHLVEAKCVTLIQNQIALFPDAPTLRGQRHIEELIKARQKGFITHIVFIVQKDGALCFQANTDTDPRFAKLLLQAAHCGVRVHGINCQVQEDGIWLMSSLPWKDKP
jgi:sugar fermentation stimulation protein A